MPSRKAMGTGCDVRIENAGSKLRMRNERPQSREEMALSNTAIPGKCESRPFTGMYGRHLVQPFGHQVGRAVREVVAGNRLGGICRKVTQILMGANLYDVFYFFLGDCHLTLEAVVALSSGVKEECRV